MNAQEEESLITSIGEAILPEGESIPAFDKESARRVSAHLRREGVDTYRAFQGLLRGLDIACKLRYGRGLRRCTPTKRLELFRALYERTPATRLASKLALAPLKTLHLDHPRVYRSVGCQYRAEPAPRESKRQVDAQVFNGDSLEGLANLECDVVVVGSGAGGAVVASELARQGHEVIILETGDFLERSDFTTLSRPEMIQRAYRPLTETTAVGNTLIPILVGRSVGGSTTVNSGTCFRTPDDVLLRWSTERRMEALHPKHMGRYFQKVEEILQVAPATSETLNGSAHVIARGCDALGYAHGPLHRNAPGCDGQGLCVFGCPTDAKQSTNVSYVPRALKAGALLVTGAQVERVLVHQGAAYGVLAKVKTRTGERHTLTVRARRVVMACGALHSPALLMKSGLARHNPHLGRHLSIHPATSAYARMPEEVNGQHGIPQGYAIKEFRHEGLMFEGAFTPLEFLALDLPFLGAPLVETLEAYRHLAAFGIMVKDEGRGRIVLGPQGKAQVLYNLGREEVARLSRGVAILAKVYLEAGAEEVYLPLRKRSLIRHPRDLEEFSSQRLKSWDFELTAYHPLGSARMGACSQEGVVDTDHEVYGIRGLHVVDASSVPTSLGVNPQITIMALATRAAERIGARLHGRPS